MLAQLSDLYRIVNPDPTDATITQRRESIGAFVETLKDPMLERACADLAAFGIHNGTSERTLELAKSLVAAIQVQQPAFQSDPALNALDLQVCAGVALGELLASEGDIGTASLVISALGTRPLPGERYLGEFVSALLRAARTKLEPLAATARAREWPTMPEVKGADGPALQKSMNSALQTFAEAVQGVMKADQEELNVLWWTFGATSTTLSKPFSALDVPQRVLAAGSELAQLVLLPPNGRASGFLSELIGDDVNLTVQELIRASSRELLSSVVGAASGDEALTANAALRPLTWLCQRRIDSGMASGWEAEFEQKTRVSAVETRSAVTWGVQIFNECVATRLTDGASQ